MVVLVSPLSSSCQTCHGNAHGGLINRSLTSGEKPPRRRNVPPDGEEVTHGYLWPGTLIGPPMARARPDLASKTRRRRGDGAAPSAASPAGGASAPGPSERPRTACWFDGQAMARKLKGHLQPPAFEDPPTKPAQCLNWRISMLPLD